MVRVACLALLATVCFGSPVNLIEKSEETAASTYSYAADVSTSVSLQGFTCMRSSGYSTVFIELYTGTFSTGEINPSCLQNIQNAATANVGIEIYVTPSTSSYLTGTQQFDTAYNYLVQNGIAVSAIWLKVTHPIMWRDTQFNIQIIREFITRAKQYSLRVGIYTNWYDWQEITESWNGGTLLGPISLWYWNANGRGVNAASAINMADFRPFGGFNAAAVKLYAFEVPVCSVTVHQLIYPQSANAVVALQHTSKTDPAADLAKPAKIVVGNLQF